MMEAVFQWFDSYYTVPTQRMQIFVLAFSASEK